MNTSVWELLPSGDRRNIAFVPKDNLAIDAAWFDGCLLSDVWRPRPVETVRPRGRLVDFVSFLPSAIAVSQKAIDILQPIVGNNCEFLPLATVRKHRFFVMNVITVINCIDENLSEIDFAPERPGQILAVRRMLFKHNINTTPPAFKALGYKSAIYVGASFVSAVVMSSLKGAAFSDRGQDRLFTIMHGKPINVVEGVIP